MADDQWVIYGPITTGAAELSHAFAPEGLEFRSLLTGDAAGRMLLWTQEGFALANSAVLRLGFRENGATGSCPASETCTFEIEVLLEVVRRDGDPRESEPEITMHYSATRAVQPGSSETTARVHALWKGSEPLSIDVEPVDSTAATADRGLELRIDGNGTAIGAFKNSSGSWVTLQGNATLRDPSGLPDLMVRISLRVQSAGYANASGVVTLTTFDAQTEIPRLRFLEGRTIVSDAATQVVELGTPAHTVLEVHPSWPPIPGALYVWASRDSDPYPGNDDEFGPFTFRKEFTLPDQAECEGTVRVSADDAHEVTLNGQLIGYDGPLARREYEGEPYWRTLEEFLVSPYLTGGLNVLSIRAANYNVPGYNPAGLAFRLDTRCILLPIPVSLPRIEAQGYPPSRVAPGRPFQYEFDLTNDGSGPAIALVEVGVPDSLSVANVSAAKPPQVLAREKGAVYLAIPLARFERERVSIELALDPDAVIFPEQEANETRRIGIGERLPFSIKILAEVPASEWEQLRTQPAATILSSAGALAKASRERAIGDFLQLDPEERLSAVERLREQGFRVVADELMVRAVAPQIDTSSPGSLSVQTLHNLPGASSFQDETKGSIDVLLEWIDAIKKGDKETLRALEQRMTPALKDAFESMCTKSNSWKKLGDNVYQAGNTEIRFNVQMNDPKTGLPLEYLDPGTGKPTKMRPDLLIIRKDASGKIKEIVVHDWVSKGSAGHLRKTQAYVQVLGQAFDVPVKGADFDLKFLQKIEVPEKGEIKRIIRKGAEAVVDVEPPGAVAKFAGTKAAKLGGKVATGVCKVIPFAGTGASVVSIAIDPSVENIVLNAPGQIPVLGDAWDLGVLIGTLIDELGGGLFEAEKVSDALGDAMFQIAQENGGGATGYLKGTLKFYGEFFGRFMNPKKCNGSCCTELVASFDPNEIRAEPSRYLRGNETVEFTVLFENLPNATASAEDIRVEVTLGQGFDLDSVVALAASHPGSLTRFSVDPSRRALLWSFESISLPPNRLPPEGEGWVRFRALPNASVVEGSPLQTHADIYFDFNPPIRTNILEHIIDRTPPSTRAELRTAEAGAATFALVGADAGSGIRDAFILVAEDDEPSLPHAVRNGTASASLSGRTIRVSSVASDLAGNGEPSPEEPDLVMLRVLVTGPVGATFGSGWYAKGGEVRFGVVQTSLPTGVGILDALGAHRVFKGWATRDGNLSFEGSEPRISSLSEPLEVEASYETDYGASLLVLGALVIAGVAGAAAIRARLRRK